MSRNISKWGRPVLGVAAIGTLAALPILGGCAGVETANASDATLERFTSCAALKDYAEQQALDQVGPYGLGGGVGILADGVARASTAPTAALESSGGTADQAAAKVPGTDFSTTNVQEAGIDEPDIVKSDGTRIFAIARNRLYAVDTSGATPRIVGSMAMPKDIFARDMLLSGTTLLVMGDGPTAVRPLPASQGGDTPASGKVAADAISSFPAFGGSVLMRVDVSDPAAMGVVERLETEARYVNARLTGTTARVVIVGGAPMGIDFQFPTDASGEAAATQANRAKLRRTTADNWVPRYTVTTASGTSAAQPVVACDAVSRPQQFSGLGTLTVMTIDLTRGLTPIDSDAVMASGENVYASAQALYVATNRWIEPQPDGTIDPDTVTTTQIHKFETADAASTDYRGSGTVIGNLLNQFSMSEHEGVLRVATTEAGQAFIGGDGAVDTERVSESYVSTLAEQGGKLVTLGQVGDLGKDERIFAVRFVGSTGYVVTFKQTDPLYVVDLSDPAAPKVSGELKIAGYSAYLHPIGDNLLIGVGQDATEEGITKGLQISLFDVSDPSAPKRLQNRVLEGAGSEAEWDHHAFLWWPSKSLAVVPYQRFGPVTIEPAPAGGAAPDIAPFGQVEAGAVGMRVSRDAIDEAGRVLHPYDPTFGFGVRRSIVIGDSLFTLSDAGFKASGIDNFAERAWLPFA